MPRQWKGKGSNKTVLFLLICYNNQRPSGQSYYYQHFPPSPTSPPTNLEVKRPEPGKERGEDPGQGHAVNLKYETSSIDQRVFQAHQHNSEPTEIEKYGK